MLNCYLISIKCLIFDYEEGGYSQPGDSFFGGNALDTDSQLSFLIAAGNDPAELYQIESLSIKISTVPTPASALLFLLGLVGVHQVSRRKSHRVT